MTARTAAHRPGLSRREWLVGISLLGLTGVAAQDGPKVAASEAPEEEAIRALAMKVGLKVVRTSHSTHFLGIGDASAPIQAGALRLCESLATSYQKHFESKGFAVRLPREPMSVVVLASRSSYEAFTGEPAGDFDGGQYDVEANRLVMFNFAGDGKRGGASATQLNTFTLVHEAMHQLTYATGLLNRAGDVPKAVSEGFATYGELWQMGQPRMGQDNSHRLKAVGKEWIPVKRLLIDDTLFENAATEQMAYGEAWLLIHTLMNPRAESLKGKLKPYLEAIRDRQNSGSRVADATNAFGDLEQLDKSLQRAMRR